MSDDQRLKAFARRDDVDDFRQLLERHASMVYAIARRKTGDHGTAQEVSQAVFAALARKAEHLTDHSAISRWLFRAAVYETAKAQRSEARRRQRLERLASASADSDPRPVEPDYEHLDEAVADLPENDRTIVLLRFYDGRSFREIAAVTGKSEPAARMQMRRALKKLSRRLGRHRTATAITNTIAVMTKAKLFPAVAVAIIASIPPAAVWRNKHQLQELVGDLRHQQQLRTPPSLASASTSDTPGRTSTAPSPTGPAAAPLPAASLTELWDTALFQPDPVKRQQLGSHGNQPETISALLDVGLPPDVVEEAHDSPHQIASVISYGLTQTPDGDGSGILWTGPSPTEAASFDSFREDQENRQILIEHGFIEVHQAIDN